MADTDLPVVARIHRAAFPRSAMTLLGPDTVEAYYRWLKDGPHESEPVVIEDDGVVTGFLVSGRFQRALGGFLDRNRGAVLRAALRRPGVVVAPEFRATVRTALTLLVLRRPPRNQAEPLVPAGESWGVLAIAVDPEARRRGHGRTLLAHAEAEALGVGAAFLRLSVDPGNEGAVAFYEAEGWARAEAADGSWHGTMTRLVPH